MKDSLQLLHLGPIAPPTKPLRVIGIDLGTTNSTVCEIVWQPGEDTPGPARCLSIDQETTQGLYTHVLVPSVVTLHEDKTWVGEGAKRLAAAHGGLQEKKLWFAETKNDIGVCRTYHRAPAELRSARAVAAKILKFLYQAATSESDIAPSRTVVTVPASFQVAQREDTVAAAQRAGITLENGELLDEPVAAFLAYLAECPQQCDDYLPESGAAKNLLVFDFGGGTCDVAVLRIGREANGRVTAAPLSVSRYHRLGGGDIDRAIIHEVLLPQLMAQNGLMPHSLSYEDKRQHVQPALLGVAEALKQRLSIEIARLKKLMRWDTTDKSGLAQTQPGPYPVELKDRTLTLLSPRLSALEFEAVLRPFLDRDLLMPREDEYRMSCSIFAPLEDALSRGRISSEEIDLCLLAGGSSLLPQVVEEVGGYFKRAKILTFPGRDETQTAVAKGAALHALSLALTRRPMFQCICHDDICFRTSSGPVVLVPRGAELPFPPDGGFQQLDDFRAPETVNPGTAVEIRVEIFAAEDQRPLLKEVWSMRGPVKKGAPLRLKVRFDQNQVLYLHMCVPGADSSFFEGHVENPLTHVVNPNQIKSKIEDIEESFRTEKVTQEEMADRLEDLADLYRSIRQFEKALSIYSRAAQLQALPQAYLLNRMAFCARDLGTGNEPSGSLRRQTESHLGPAHCSTGHSQKSNGTVLPRPLP